ncbi:hypothetical protein EMIHUDRAFT_219951 [Emiliania huxleyi CCMP1516]|uniref:Trichohyalin-plectin-homology domain-containing protein n=2 Tax=Emiliania huxleyi TaxID=2903 RepID=A0A0D3I3J1_EMIH1|nr:hypothetical protein EMIHUDRAFT_219951 [Emiliania huxleyi CCMP1516]EOD05826.1 hypothetical protein EMIHUDRAFT_219951 [Emiliania huxleyi CCMP1516]|eukprot:XP_005758255.1 hypothetical protein EMIHUDRAFT_219951 [Emiliania huxleyi CCMP1516]
MQQHDKEEEAAAVERRRIETLLGEEAAKESKLRKHNERVAVAAAVKLQVSEGAAQRRRDEERARLEKEARVLDVHAQRDKPALAIEEIAKANHARASAMREEAERLAAAAAEERRAEDERRRAQGRDLIQQIRALELVPRKRVVALDPTYIPNIGVEEERSAEEKKKRERILAAKASKEKELKARLSRLSHIREEAAKDAARRVEAAKRVEIEAEEQRHDRLAAAQLKLHQEIEAKRAVRLQEEARLAEELKAIKMKAQFLGADASAVERKRMLSQRQGAQREAMARQDAIVEESSATLSTEAKELAQRRLNLQRQRQKHEAFLRDYEASAAQATDAARHDEAEWQASRQMLQTRLGLGLSHAGKAQVATKELGGGQSNRPNPLGLDESAIVA